MPTANVFAGNSAPLLQTDVLSMGQPEVPPSNERRTLVEALIASTVGTTIEWYDFFLYGLAASVVFPKLFFPEYDPLAGTLLSFGTYTVGFIFRPLGGAIFGYLGDRVGRKATLIMTLLLMGISTMVIGLLPTYDSIGFAAPVLLTVLRALQGLGVGGEWGGSVLLALEFGHKGKRGFYASWPQTGIPLGLLLSAGVLGLMQSILDDSDFYAWGWRIPFLLSGLLIILGFLIRARLTETPLFKKVRESGQISRTPVRETLRKHWRTVLLTAGARLSENTCFYLFTAFIITYATAELGMEKGFILRCIMITAALEFFAIPIYGLLSDYWSRKGMFTLGCLIQILFAFPYFMLLDTRDPLIVGLAIIVSLLGAHAILISIVGSFFPELFGTRLRYTGASLGYQLTGPLGGGLAPVIAVSLMHAFPHQYWPIALYIILISAVSLACTYYLAETSRKDLTLDD